MRWAVCSCLVGAHGWNRTVPTSGSHQITIKASVGCPGHRRPRFYLLTITDAYRLYQLGSAISEFERSALTCLSSHCRKGMFTHTLRFNEFPKPLGTTKTWVSNKPPPFSSRSPYRERPGCFNSQLRAYTAAPSPSHLLYLDCELGPSPTRGGEQDASPYIRRAGERATSARRRGSMKRSRLGRSSPPSSREATRGSAPRLMRRKGARPRRPERCPDDGGTTILH
ncbi:hypothetical protein EDB85DRAFT_1412868 [Lactarius pseudohatsudake]|nr:hypothetical protein EDB85DRAFT_1412868 [Lactarius pseudohatsudake]